MTEEPTQDMIDIYLDEMDNIKQSDKSKHASNLTPLTRSNTDQEILHMIEKLVDLITDSNSVTTEEMNRMETTFGSEQAIKNLKNRRNEVIKTEIARLEGLLVQQGTP